MTPCCSCPSLGEYAIGKWVLFSPSSSLSRRRGWLPAAYTAPANTMLSCWLSYGDKRQGEERTVTYQHGGEDRRGKSPWSCNWELLIFSWWQARLSGKWSHSPRIAFPASSSHSFQITLVSTSFTTLCTAFRHLAEQRLRAQVSSGQPQAPLHVPAASRKWCQWLAVRS